jgi:hypothetical protein
LKVLVLTDGVAGHDRASHGVLAALSRGRQVHAQWLGIAETGGGSRRFSRMAAATGDPGRFLATRVRLAPERVAPMFGAAADGWPPHADVVVSTGPSTAAANIAAARRYGARNVYCGFHKWPVLGFTVILSPVPTWSRVVATVPRPSDIDAADFPPPRPLDGPGERRIALLFGGESKHYRYTAADMDTLGAALGGLLAALPGARLLAFDSRRTDAALFERLLAALPAGRVEPRRFAEGGVASNRDAFAADLALVTADSLSMITEALAAARPTMVIRADAYRGPARDRREIDLLARRGLVAEATFAAVDLSAALAVPRPPTTSQLAALESVLASRGI